LTGDLEQVFCELLRVDLEEWIALKELWQNQTAWRVHTIPKKGGERTIHDPSDPLKKILRGVLAHVLGCIPVHRCVHGARARTSILTNARTHAGFGQAFYLLDLKNAFPSVTRERVYGCVRPKLIALLPDMAGVTEQEASLLASVILDLVQVEKGLPQGFPTSPALLNIVLVPLDREIVKVLRAHDPSGMLHRYTRYVDDLTISTSLSSIDPELRKALRNAIKKAGWRTNHAKVRYHGLVEEGADTERSSHMPMVTGLVPQIDGRVTIPRWKLNQYRARMHTLLQESVPLSRTAHDELVGIIGFVGMVYDDRPPSNIRALYEQACAKFSLRERSEAARYQYPE